MITPIHSPTFANSQWQHISLPSSRGFVPPSTDNPPCRTCYQLVAISMGILYLDVCLALGCTVWLSLIYRARSRVWQSLPPGPKPKWIVGNMFDVPKTDEWITYTDWGKQWGEVVYISVLLTPIVILNSLRVANELLEKRGNIYSSRPPMPMAVDLAKFDWAFSALPYTPEFRARRRIFEQHFRASMLWKYEEKLLSATHKLLRDLLRTPQDFSGHIKLAIGTIILDIIYGFKAQSVEDKWIALSDEVAQNFSIAARPGAWLVDVMPFLQHVPDWMPFTHFKKVARHIQKTSDILIEAPFAVVQEAWANGVAKSCMVSDVLEDNLHGANVDEKDLKEAAAIAYAAGVDTMLTVLRSLFLYMARNPEPQCKAQEELDRVCPDRLPQPGDRSHLPYVESVIMEVCRIHATIPQCIPHRLDAEDMFEGNRLPKGSIIIPNIWGMLHDEAMYPSSFEFNPDRFMKAGQLCRDVVDPRNMFFGFGRRECPGRALAESELFLAISMILKVFKIEPPLDSNGVPIIPEPKYASGIFSYPLDFECRITPRTEHMKDLVMHLQD